MFMMSIAFVGITIPGLVFMAFLGVRCNKNYYNTQLERTLKEHNKLLCEQDEYHREEIKQLEKFYELKLKNLEEKLESKGV